MRVRLGTVEVSELARWGIAFWVDPDADRPAGHDLVNSFLERHVETALEEAVNIARAEGRSASD